MESSLLEHHVQRELCKTRLAYRQGRKLTAVKTYTIADESVYLLVYGVPKINLQSELKNLCQKYGKVMVIRPCTEYPVEEFTECFKIKYERIQSARIAKRMIDTKNFYGGSLHVCYAPECETVEELREKLKQRRFDVWKRMKQNQANNEPINSQMNYQSTLNSDPSHYETNQFSNNLPPVVPHPNSIDINEPSTSNLQHYYTIDNRENCDNTIDKPINDGGYNYGVKDESKIVNNISNDRKKLKKDDVEYVFKRKRCKKDLAMKDKIEELREALANESTTVTQQPSVTIDSSLNKGKIVVCDVKEVKIFSAPKRSNQQIKIQIKKD